MQPLPIDPHVGEIRALLRAHRAVVVVAPPGAGKTTRLPPALSADGPVLLLQPRRIAARALARRIAQEQQLELGVDVGWQVRFERRFTARTRLLVATEGILTARAQADPLLSDFRSIVIDEFHERSVHGDLALALARQAALARDDLWLLVMSATLDAQPVAAFLGGCPIVEISARPHPVEIGYRPGVALRGALREALDHGRGHVLVFLPGAPEIRRAQAELGWADPEALLLPLHGSLDAAAQDLALAPASRRKLVLATNIAETSLTIDGVSAVVDGGEHKLLRHDPARGLDRLEAERISLDSADQRAGRAGRTGPGLCLRLWDPRERLRPHREAELQRIDLAGVLLDVLAWGGDPQRFAWFEPPPEPALAAALTLLERLGAVRGRTLTAQGEAMARLPLHPRLGRLLLATGGSRRAATLCALLTERLPPAGGSDILLRLGAAHTLPYTVARVAQDLAARAARAGTDLDADDDDTLRRALLAGYPDRVARRREPFAPRLLLASGHGGLLQGDTPGGEFLVALDVAAGQSEARVRLACSIERAWLTPTRSERVHRFFPEAGRVRGFEQLWYDAILLEERVVAADPELAAPLLEQALLERGPTPELQQSLRRAAFAGLPVDYATLVREACVGMTELPEPELPFALRAQLERLAPEWLALPAGRRARLDYRDDGSVAASVKLQHLFGVAETPRVGPRREPVLLLLLSPAGRPVQTTRDLASFWQRTYPEVRRELRGRYPKHAWPEDPRQG